jgi:predicted dehydrogenase
VNISLRQTMSIQDQAVSSGGGKGECCDSSSKWGIIGCGDVTEVKSAPCCFKSSTNGDNDSNNSSSISNSSVVLCMRRDRDKATDYAARHGIALSCSTLEEFYALSAENGVQNVYIATPPNSHKELAIEALSRGYNVYIEKPIALNSSEANSIYESLEKYPERKLSVAHYRRELAMFQHVKSLLDCKSIGDVRSCNLRCWKTTKADELNNPDNWRLNAEVSGGGYFHDLAPHQLDILIYLFGYPLSSQGISSTPSQGSGTHLLAMDHVYGLSVFPNNVVFNGSWCFAVPERDAVDECLITGTTGSIKFSFFGLSGTLCLISATHSDNPKTEEWVYEHPKHIQEPMISKVISYFDSSIARNPCSIQDAIVVMNMMDTFSSS